MAGQHDFREFDSAVLADRLTIVSIALFVVYAITVVAALLPVRLLDTAWQLSLISALLDSAAIPLVALGLLHLAAYLDPGNPALQQRRDAVARWAILAVLGFLLLIPLQGYASWKSVATAQARVDLQLTTAEATFGLIRDTINTSTSIDNLQARLQSLQTPSLGIRFENLGLPLPETKRQLLIRLNEVQEQVKARIRAPAPQAIEEVAKNSLRVMISATALAVGFAAGAQRRTSDVPFVVELHTWWTLRGARRPREAAGGLVAALPILGSPSPREEDYFERLVPQDDQDPPTEDAPGPEKRP